VIDTSSERVVRTTCNRDCPDACGIVATVAGGRVVRIQGDPEHPVTRGFLCYRTSRFLERQYSPDRLTAPLLKRGGRHVPISWDDALNLVAEKLLRVKSESGAASILFYRSGGTLGLVKLVTEHFFERFGPVAVKSGDICSGAGETAQLTDFGICESNDLFDLENARTIVLWGKNPHVSNLHLLPVLKRAREAGARIVLIDPVRHRGVEVSDLYVQPRPGGDAAIALGIARRLFETGATDPEAPSYCDHFDEFRSLALSRDHASWAETAGIAPEELDALAGAYAAGPSAILVGWGMQRRTRGSAAIRTLDALAAVSGNLGIPGGGVSFYFRRRAPFDTSFTDAAASAPRRVPEPLLGRGILEASEPPIRIVWIMAGNPVAMLPDSHSVARALATREMTVVVDAFLTDTAREAHLVLPTTTMLEDDDLLGAYGHHWLGEVRPVVPPPEGVKTDYEITQELARRVGLEAEFSSGIEDWKRRMLRPIEGRGASLEDLRRGAVKNPLAERVLFADRRFPTPSGRVNLIRAIDAEPMTLPAARPLFLVAISTEKAQSSQWVRPPDGPATATVHPDAAPGLRDGDLATISSELGSMTVRLRLDARQRRDIVLMAKGGALSSGHCTNALTPATLTDAGLGAAYYDTPVAISPRI
jgi:anaerobic selenocysteine-containing dehydrogenase